MVCSDCGRDVPDGARFCPQCGAPVAAAGAEFASPLPAEGEGAARFASAMPSGQGEPAAEVPLWSGTYSPKAMLGPAVGLAVVCLVAMIFVAVLWNTGVGSLVWLAAVVLLWTCFGLLLAYRRTTVRYRLTTYRLFHELGLLSRVGNRIEVIDIDDVTVRQGLVERLLGVGTIVVQSSDRTDPELRMAGIEDVKRVADLIDDTRRAERHRRGLHLEAI